MKTIRLNSEYSLVDGKVLVGKFGMEFDDYSVVDAPEYRIGNPALLVSKTNVSPNAIRAGENVPVFSLRFDCVADGMGGNSNSNIKLHSGWRGTTNDVSVSAHGVVKIVKIRELKNGQVAVTVK